LYRHQGSVQAVRPIGGVEVELYSFLTTALEGVRGQLHAPADLYPGKHPVWTGAENLAPPGFDPRTFQPVATRYTD